MPLYEYKCSACAHKFERIVKFSDPPLKTCPKCGEHAIDQLISAPAVQFKGSGWYVTDYARKSGAGPTSSSSPKPDGGTDTASTSSANGSSSAAGEKSSGDSSSSSGNASSTASSASTGSTAGDSGSAKSGTTATSK